MDAGAAPGWAGDAQDAVEGGHPVLQADQPAVRGGMGTADAVVADVDDESAVRRRDAESDGRGVGVLGDVGERLGGDLVGRGLHGRR